MRHLNGHRHRASDDLQAITHLVVPESALSFIETAAQTLQQSREIYLRRMSATDAETDAP